MPDDSSLTYWEEVCVHRFLLLLELWSEPDARLSPRVARLLGAVEGEECASEIIYMAKSGR